MSCGWIAGLPPLPAPRPLAGDRRVPRLVVGAGFTGLAAARRLAELDPERPVLLVDAGRAGCGGAGRSSGFLVEHAHFVAALGAEGSRHWVGLARFGIEELRRRVEAEDIDCAWDERGWMHAVATPEAEPELAGLAAWMEELGAPCERLDAAGVEAVTGTPYYRAAVRMPGSVTVQPAALARGLAGSLPEGVELAEETRVTGFTRAGDGWEVETSGGRVRAGELFVATNAELPDLGLWKRRLLPLWTFASLTRPLTESEAEQLGGEPAWGLVAGDTLGSTLRRTVDGRLLVRNTVRWSRRRRPLPRWLETGRQAHRRALLDRFPDRPSLAALPFEHTWGGLLGMSRNRAHAFGRLAPGLFSAGGYNGAGIVSGTVAGRLLADAALGADSPELDAVRSLPGPSWIPPEPLLGLGVRLELARLGRRAHGRI